MKIAAKNWKACLIAGLAAGIMVLWQVDKAGAQSWAQLARLSASDEAEDNSFGYSVSMGYLGELAVVGCPYDDTGIGDRRGSGTAVTG